MSKEIEKRFQWYFFNMLDDGLSPTTATETAIVYTFCDIEDIGRGGVERIIDEAFKLSEGGSYHPDTSEFYVSQSEALEYDSADSFVNRFGNGVTQVDEQEDEDEEEVGSDNNGHEESPDFSIRDLQTDQDYIYLEDKEQYLVFLSSRSKPLTIPEELHQDILSAYSNWDGSEETIDEITQRFPFFTRDLFNEYRRAFGITHDHEPFSKERVTEEDTDQLAEEIYNNKKHKLAKKAEQKARRENQKAAEKWNHFDVAIIDPLSEIVSNNFSKYQPPKLEMKEADHDFCVVANLYDIHIGRFGWSDQVGKGYDIDKAKDVVTQKTSYIISKLQKRGRPEKVFFLLGGDVFDIDSLDYETTNGTPQEVASTLPEIIDEGQQLAIHVIDQYRQIAPVEIMLTPGNHDEALSHTLINFIKAYYNETSDVEIHEGSENHQYRVYAQYGNTLIGASHGQSERRSNISEIMAQEQRDAWGNTEHSIYLVGHKHNEKTTQSDISGTMVYQVPSIAEQNTWEHKNGYIKRSALSCHIINKQSGVDAIEYAVPEEPIFQRD